MKTSIKTRLVSSILIVLAIVSGRAQTTQYQFDFKNFEQQILAYQPKQGDLSVKSYNHGNMILTETKKAVENDAENFSLADYMNILSCFLSLNQSKENINLAYEKLKLADGSCEYFLHANMFKSEKYDIIRMDIKAQIAICKMSDTTAKQIFDLGDYATKNNVNEDLVRLMDKMERLDKMNRKGKSVDWSKQTSLDQTNQQVIDSLYNVHQTYIGTSLVGEKFSHVMWSVIQHSNVDMMEKYIPILHTAVQQNDLNVTPFKMLLDRYYGLKYGYQLFGSQSGFGFKLADDKTRKDIEIKYDLE